MSAEAMDSSAQSDRLPPTTESRHRLEWTLRPARDTEIETLAELRAMVMRADLERLGRYDDDRVRQRLRDSFSTRHTSVIMIDGGVAGCLTVRPVAGGQLLEHFYLAPAYQGHGVGSEVLRTQLKDLDARGAIVRLIVLRGSPAQRLYDRHGFVTERAAAVDVLMVRSPRTGTAPSA